MEGCLTKTLRSLRRLDEEAVQEVLRNESSRLEVTKSLLGLLFNICLDKSIPLSHRLKARFKTFTPLVLQLISGANRGPNKTKGLLEKKRLLIQNPGFVKLLTEACPANQDTS